MHHSLPLLNYHYPSTPSIFSNRETGSNINYSKRSIVKSLMAKVVLFGGNVPFLSSKFHFSVPSVAHLGDLA